MIDTIEKQKEFQRFVGFPIDSNLESDRNELSEIYLFKMIEEVVELRKEIPSTMNRWSKSQKIVSKDRVLEELSDVIFFLMNFCITWKLSASEILDTMKKVQSDNFQKVKEKKMEMLNEEMLVLPGYTIGIGQGNLSPKYIFIGQNPSDGIPHGYKVWSDANHGASKVLLPTLGEEVVSQSYFTNLVKSVTPQNVPPSETLVQFWREYLLRELEILQAGNPSVKIITMGSFASKNIGLDTTTIHHPAYYLRGIAVDEYHQQIIDALK